jgi:2-polyprenyl-6-methoxyphenol hydroxylase-like FAD-dependent oxidoreductase
LAGEQARRAREGEAMTTRRHVEIAGAGIAGLTAACVLAHRGWTVRVHERTPVLREIGAGIYLKENSLRVLKEINVFGSIRQLGVRLQEGQIRDERDRILLRRRMIQEEAFTTLRGDLHRALAERAEQLGVEIVTGVSVMGAHPEGTLELDSGKVLRADLIIGADGHRSRVCESIGLTARVETLPDGATRLLIPRTDREREALSREYWSGSCRLGVVPCSARDVYVFLIAPEAIADASAVPVNKKFWARQFLHLADIVERFPERNGRHDLHVLVRVHGWHKGRVAVLGDAAHAQPPNLGQGAGMSMANASALGAFLDRERTVEVALGAWEAARRPISEQVQRWSYRYGVIGYGWPGLYDLRSALIWTVGHVGFTSRKWGELWRGGLKFSELRAG